ncbi:MAG TPA: NAD(P)/FAD-dependent oxidoreductase [Chloroflexia bacterium]|nr:NAD(P)/FAD-dependent oxidoreductase [Chloroflexia bacterium]
MNNHTYDALFIGAGHNSLVCAAYLARDGKKIGVFEKNNFVGGASATSEIFPNYRSDLGASAHTFIHLTPIVQDLSLSDYGLEYIDVDPFYFAPFPDGSYLTLWRSVERTCDEIARFSTEDAVAYRRFCDRWLPFARLVADLMMTSPAPGAMIKAISHATRTYRGSLGIYLHQLRWSMHDFLAKNFRSEKVKACLGWISAQVGLPPNQPGTAIFVVWQVIYHLCGIKVARGGSGMLAQALVSYIQAHGGTVQTNHAAKRILIEDGCAIGIDTESGERFQAKTVVSGAHIKTTARLLGDKLPTGMERRIKSLKMANGSGVVLRIAASGLPQYTACSDLFANRAIQLIAPSTDYLMTAWDAYKNGERSQRPLLAVMTFSSVDSTRNTGISIWAQYYPYQFAGSQTWNKETETQVVQDILDTLATYAPNIRDVIIESRLHTPRWIEEELGLLNADLQHIQVTFDQMFIFRPGLRLSGYRTPIRGLYLTGASTHPGGGITGMPGWNSARTILADIDQDTVKKR